MTNQKIDNPLLRLILVIFGITGLVFIVLYSFNFDKLGFEFTALGYDITEIFVATIVILVGILFSTLFKSGIFGQWIVDS